MKNRGSPKGTSEQDGSKRKPPVRIPLSFDEAVEGLLGVKPEPKKAEKPAKKKSARKKK